MRVPRTPALGLAMRPIAIFACAVMLVSLPATAYAQAGSIGGTVGKQDKSISGGTTPEESNPPVSKPNSVRSLNPSQRQPERIPLVSGQYDVVASGYSSTFTITVSNSKFSGSSKWACCPGPRIDPIIQGRIQNGRISFVRDCSGQGYPGECRQEYTGSITENGASGQWTGTPFGAGSWTMRKH
jgi:hypothetical protein